jgi:hypothetical protein
VKRLRLCLWCSSLRRRVAILSSPSCCCGTLRLHFVQRVRARYSGSCISSFDITQPHGPARRIDWSLRWGRRTTRGSCGGVRRCAAESVHTRWVRDVYLRLSCGRCGPEWWWVKLLLVILRGLLWLSACALFSGCTLEEVAVIWKFWTARTFWHDPNRRCSSPFCQAGARIGVSAQCRAIWVVGVESWPPLVAVSATSSGGSVGPHARLAWPRVVSSSLLCVGRRC